MSQLSEEEFSLYVKRVRPALRRWAYQLSGDWDEADDLVQKALIALYGHWDALERHAELAAYTRKIIFRLVVSDRRTARRSREVVQDLLPEPDPAPDLSASLGERLALTSALAHLGARQRTVVFLRFWADLSVGEVAGALGCSRGTVRSQTSRALATLRSMLQADFPRPKSGLVTTGSRSAGVADRAQVANG